MRNMSSVPEKKVAFLLRSASLQKIRCSANRLQRSIFSKESKESSIIHHLKSTISTSQSLLHKPLVNSLITCVRILCVAMAYWMNLIMRFSVIPISEKSDRFIITINHFISKHQSDFDIKAITKLLAAQSERILLIVASHLCMLIIYLQLGLIAYLVCLTQLKIGFVFLVACIAIIHVLVSEISFMTKKINSRASRRTHYENSKIKTNRIQINNTKSNRLKVD